MLVSLHAIMLPLPDGTVMVWRASDINPLMHRIIQWIQDFDVALLRYLNPAKDNNWIAFFQLISNTTSEIAYGLPILLLAVGLLQRNRILRLGGILALLTVFLADYAALFLKGLVHRIRPFEAISDIIRYSDAGNASFPSGHTTQAMATAFAITLFFRKPRYAVPVLAWAILVGYGRIYLGVHYPSDVIGAILLSAIIAVLVTVPGKRIAAGPTKR